MSDWKLISEKPEEGTVAVLYSKNRTWMNMDGETVSFGEQRDHAERGEIAYWKNGEWFEAGTGHQVFEPHTHDHPDNLPTHWMPFHIPA